MAMTEIESYIVGAARQRGIDPQIAVRVAQSEGGIIEYVKQAIFNTGRSFWPFQLHYGGGAWSAWGSTVGLGNEFTRRTGYQPGDPKAWKASIDFALDWAKQYGWDAWYGAKAIGITGFRGIGTTNNSGMTGVEYAFPVLGYNGNPKNTYHTPGATDLFAPRGTPVVAVRGGKVLDSGYDSLGGNYVTIKGTDGLDYYYAHLNESASVNRGDVVMTAQRIGSVGDTGNAKGKEPHLHIGIGHGIKNGSGADGGTGIGFDAQSFLTNLLQKVGSYLPDPLAGLSSVVDGAGSVINMITNPGGFFLANIGQIVGQATQTVTHTFWQGMVNYFEDRAAAMIFLLSAGVMITLGLLAIATSATGPVKENVRTVGNVVGAGQAIKGFAAAKTVVAAAV